MLTRRLEDTLTNVSLQSGKTCLSNYLSGATESSGGAYHPTKGVRILEFEVMGEREGEMTQVDVELWDCSGNREWVWPVARGSPLFIRAALQ